MAAAHRSRRDIRLTAVAAAVVLGIAVFGGSATVFDADAAGAAVPANGSGFGRLGPLVGTLTPSDPGAPPTPTGFAIARLALAQLGRGLNGPNTIDGRDFGDSSALPDAWCAEFAAWTWSSAGVDVAGLDGWAGSFLSYGEAHGTYRPAGPRVGDAALFALDPAVAAAAAAGRLGQVHAISHVGIVVAVSATTVTVVNGDWGDGAGGAKKVRLSTFSTARSDAGDDAPGMRQYLAGYVAPLGL